MSGRPPDFDALVGGDLADEERDRLRRVHELLIEAGPPPELTPRLQAPRAAPRATVVSLPQRRRGAVLLVAAAVTLAVFGAGWLVGGRSRSVHVERTVAMVGPGGAHASLQILAADRAGNWPMRMTVSGLAVLPRGATYTLWLTKRGAPEASCGTFTVGTGATTVRLNAPYRLKEYDGWIVVRSGRTTPLLTTASV